MEQWNACMYAFVYVSMYKGRLKGSWTGHSTPLLCWGRPWHAKLYWWG